MKKFLALLILIISNTTFTLAQTETIVGEWKTIDDETGKPKSHVTIYELDGKYFGKVNKLIGRDDNPVCEKCSSSDPRKNQPVLGMQIIQRMEKENNKYTGGVILDPEKGKEYTCSMWLENENTLKVRGWLAFFYRTQTWTRVH